LPKRTRRNQKEADQDQVENQNRLAKLDKPGGVGLENVVRDRVVPDIRNICAVSMGWHHEG
jgi:hypothetical protein